MLNRDPVRSLSWALQRALKHDLLDVVAPSAGDGPPRQDRRRPRGPECDVLMFGQVWSGSDLGFEEEGAEVRLECDTTVIIGPAQDACVYASTQLLYHVVKPNRRFFLDVAAHGMTSKAEAGSYEGPDDPVTEAVDIEVGFMLAKLNAQVRVSEPQRASLVARYLRRCAASLDGL